jgi:hypothetical protein
MIGPLLPQLRVFKVLLPREVRSPSTKYARKTLPRQHRTKCPQLGKEWGKTISHNVNMRTRQLGTRDNIKRQFFWAVSKSWFRSQQGIVFSVLTLLSQQERNPPVLTLVQSTERKIIEISLRPIYIWTLRTESGDTHCEKPQMEETGDSIGKITNFVTCSTRHRVTFRLWRVSYWILNRALPLIIKS